MNAPAFVQTQIKAVRDLVDASMLNMTDEQFNWEPPGTANSIKSTFIHLVFAEDMFVHRLILGQPTLWEHEGWAKQVGLERAPGGGGGYEEAKAVQVGVAGALAYQQAVRAACDAYLSGLTGEELDRRIKMWSGEQPVAFALTTMAAHSAGHSGEIAAVRGIQGAKGLPF